MKSPCFANTNTEEINFAQFEQTLVSAIAYDHKKTIKNLNMNEISVYFLINLNDFMPSLVLMEIMYGAEGK